MLGTREYPIEIVETSEFLRATKKLFSENEVALLRNYVAYNPEVGDVIPGTGGVRKLRWATGNKGKSHGARVIYFFRDLNMPLYLLTAYAKSTKINITARERSEMKKLVGGLVDDHMEEKRSRFTAD